MEEKKMKVLKIKENSDRSVTIDCEFTLFELKVIKRTLGIGRLTKKRLTQFIQKAIIVGAKKEVMK